MATHGTQGEVDDRPCGHADSWCNQITMSAARSGVMAGPATVDD